MVNNFHPTGTFRPDIAANCGRTVLILFSFSQSGARRDIRNQAHIPLSLRTARTQDQSFSLSLCVWREEDEKKQANSNFATTWPSDREEDAQKLQILCIFQQIPP
jgi:hypothetical protein